MIKDILEQLAPLDAQIAALKGSGSDMEAITAHASELAELAVEEDEILRSCGPLTAEDRVFLARHPERPHIDETISALFTDFFEQRGDRQRKPALKQWPDEKETRKSAPCFSEYRVAEPLHNAVNAR